jgi:hypothetical protein
MSTFFLVSGFLAGPVAAQDSEPLPTLISRLKADCPDRETAARQGRELADRILQALEQRRLDAGNAGQPEAGGQAAEGAARFLAVEFYRLAGADREARVELQEIAAAGPTDGDRAKALYLLGEEYFLREAYVPRASRTGRTRASAYAYWIQLGERFPQSPWAREVERPLRYLRLLRGAPAPAFAGRFVVPPAMDRGLELTPEALKGRVLLASFWRSDNPAEREFQVELAARLASLRGRTSAAPVEVVGVNLDLDRKACEKAIEEWDLRRPQLHDGKGFATPLAEAFGIPRVPHWLVLDGEGKVAYLGADPNACLTELARAAGKP